MGEMCYCCMTPNVERGICKKCGQPALAPDSNGNALPLGTKLGHGRLTIGKVLGHGGFGVTYLAYDHKLQRRIALKEFMPEYLAVRNGAMIQPKPNQENAYNRSMNSFLKEARALYELRAHPNIVHVFSTFKENNTAYYTMELLEGESLLDYLKKKKRISGEQAFRMLFPIMDAIRFVHKKNILHRDISPGNIMLCRDPQVPTRMRPKLIDFGAAHVAIEGYSMSYPSVKTNGFSPLEQNWAGDAQGPWMDVYSFCATVYSAVVGHVPPGSEDREKAKIAHTPDPMIPPSQAGGNISARLEEVLMRGLKHGYKERIQSMGQLMSAVKNAMASDSVYTTVELTPEVKEPERPTGRRIGAWILEQVLIGGVQTVVGFSVLQGLLSLSPSAWLMILNGRVLMPFLTTAVVFFILDVILLWTVGGTLGQIIFGLRVRSSDGQSKASFDGCFVYALFYNTVVQLICGIIWLASGKSIGPVERLLNIEVKLASEKGAQHSGAVNVSVPVVSEHRQVHQSTGGNEQPPISKPVQKHIQKPVQQPEKKAPDNPPPPAALSSATAKLVCVSVSDDPRMKDLLHKGLTIHDGDTLGREGNAKIALPSAGVSRQHCSFHFDQKNKVWLVTDEDSRNGTFVNELMVPPHTSMVVKPGAQIKVSKETFQLKY